jgi:hypothetical protein
MVKIYVFNQKNEHVFRFVLPVQFSVPCPLGPARRNVHRPWPRSNHRYKDIAGTGRGGVWGCVSLFIVFDMSHRILV